jgi:hypothetical protein
MVTENKETNGHELQATKKNGVLRIEHKERKNEWIESNAYLSISQVR